MNNDLTLAICAYNCEKYIEETLTSIINQTYQGFDLLILNDCSTDKSVQIIESFFKENPREYKLIHFEINKGLAAGRHYIEHYVKTKYLLFVDADDCPFPILIEKLYNKISNDKDLMAVGCYHEFIDSNSKKIAGGIFMGEKDKASFYEKAKNKKLIFMQPTAIINREDLLSVGGRNIEGFPEGKPRYQDLCEDLDLWTRLSDLYTSGKAIIVIPEVLCRYRKHSQGLSASSVGMGLRMKHIKSNLLRRRAAEKELSFIDYYNSLSTEEMQAIKRSAIVGDSLRNGVFLLKKGRILSGGFYILKSIIMNPQYFIQKIKANSGIFK